jgi:hypothetical protein
VEVKAVVIVPTARASGIAAFLEAWKQEPSEARIPVIEDGPSPSLFAADESLQHEPEANGGVVAQDAGAARVSER